MDGRELSGVFRDLAITSQRPDATLLLTLDQAEELLGEDATIWNQAVMDLGAYVCTARSPRCDECPVVTWCSGPSTYVAPQPQGRFEGSNRQARGAVLRALLDGPRTAGEVTRNSSLEADRIAGAIDQLVTEGLVIESTDGFALAD